MTARLLFGDSNSCLMPLILSPSGCLQELVNFDGRPETHDRGAQLFHWSQRVGEVGENPFIDPSWLVPGRDLEPDPAGLQLHTDAISVRHLSQHKMNGLSMSPTTPQGILQHPFATSPTSAHTRGFKRSASTDDEQDDGDTRPSSRRNTAVKRACNECRQQKVRTSSASPVR